MGTVVRIAGGMNGLSCLQPGETRRGCSVTTALPNKLPLALNGENLQTRFLNLLIQTGFAYGDDDGACILLSRQVQNPKSSATTGFALGGQDGPL